jgi:fermentation-respiration switch protein FrsA (DUF1100 family)
MSIINPKCSNIVNLQQKTVLLQVAFFGESQGGAVALMNIGKAEIRGAGEKLLQKFFSRPLHPHPLFKNL